MAAPFYRVQVQSNGRDITDLIDGFRFEDSVDEDDMLVLTVRSDSPSIVDDEALQEGVRLIFSFGVSNKNSGKRVAVIQDVEPNFGGDIGLTIKAFDLGLIMKKDERQDIWEDVTASDIVSRIAKRNGLKSVTDKTSKKYESLPQGNRTDFDFLKYLSTIEQDGSFRFYIRGETIYFNKIDLRQDPKRTFRYRDPDGVLISFKPSSKGSDKKGGGQNTKVTGVDPITGDIFEQKIDNSNSSDDAKLGDYPVSYNSDAIKQTDASQSDDEELKSGKQLTFPADSADEARNIANSEKKKAALNDITAEMVVEGDPSYTSDTIITVSNVGKKFTGNWYVTKAIFIVRNGQIFNCTMNLSRNASKLNVNGEDKASDTNTKSGPENGTDEKPVPVYRYDDNGNLIK